MQLLAIFVIIGAVSIGHGAFLLIPILIGLQMLRETNF